MLAQYGIVKEYGQYNKEKQSKQNIKSIAKLSKGQQIRQQLAFALSYDANVYFMDEPTGNLDVEFRDEFYDTIRALVEKDKTSVIYASHLVEEMEHFADYILWLQEKDGVGKIFFYGSIDELRDRYRIVENLEISVQLPKECIIGGSTTEYHNEFLVDITKMKKDQEVLKQMRYAELKEIMYYVEKGVVMENA